MGRSYTKYSFPDSDREDAWAIFSAFLDYRFGDGTRLHVRQTACWCSRCRHITIGEDIPTVEELRQELERLHHPNHEERELYRILGTPMADLITETEKRIEWRRSRTAPAKCLHCGSTEIAVISHDETMVHPATGERMLLSERDWADTAEWRAEYTPEGDVIASIE